MDDKYDRILYTKKGFLHLEYVEGSRISWINKKFRNTIIDGLLDPNVQKVKLVSNLVTYYYKQGKCKSFFFQN